MNDLNRQLYEAIKNGGNIDGIKKDYEVLQTHMKKQVIGLENCSGHSCFIDAVIQFLYAIPLLDYDDIIKNNDTFEDNIFKLLKFMSTYNIINSEGKYIINCDSTKITTLNDKTLNDITKIQCINFASQKKIQVNKNVLDTKQTLYDIKNYIEPFKKNFTTDIYNVIIETLNTIDINDINKINNIKKFIIENMILAQHDAEEFLSYLIYNISLYFNIDYIQNIINNNNTIINTNNFKLNIHLIDFDDNKNIKHLDINNNNLNIYITDESKIDDYQYNNNNINVNEIKYITNTSKYFIIQLNRYNIKNEKINTNVNMKFKLNIKFYNNKIVNYSLLSFIYHGGGTGGGHYVCYSKFNGEWYCINDETVTKMDKNNDYESVLEPAKTGYIYLYEKQ